jgi:uncharacterized protein (DUF433 family)
MAQTRFKFVGRGIYPLAEAARLVRIPVRRIVRWTRGYRFRVGSRWHESPPLIADAVYSSDAGQPYLEFADLIELRFLEAFLRHGVTMRGIRLTSERVRAELGPRPFSTRRLKTDGRSILMEAAGDIGEGALLDILKDQFEFRQVVSPLLKGMDFQDDEPARWWPRLKRGLVVVDPTRRFGAPIIARYGIPTKVLAAAARAEGSVEAAADWYEVSTRAVTAAVEFEAQLAA